MFAPAFPMNPHRSRRVIYLITGTALLALLACLELITGPVAVTMHELWQVLSGSEGASDTASAILLESRLPRTLTAIAAGAGLAICGMLMQSLFRNPLAGPSVLGITSGASLAVALLVMGQSVLPAFLSASHGAAVVIAGIAGAAGVLVIVLAASNRLGNTNSLLLFGILLGHVAGAVESVLQHRSSAGALRSFITWGMGRFSETNLTHALTLVVMVCVAALVVSRLTNALNIHLLGETYAQSMGMRIARFRWMMVALTGVVAGMITAWCGPVAFIGLAMPHVARMILRTSDHRLLLVPLLVTGALAGVLSDLISRHAEVPLNAITSLLGAPVVILIVFQSGKMRRMHHG